MSFSWFKFPRCSSVSDSVFRFEAVNCPRQIGKANFFSFCCDETSESFSILTEKLRDTFGDPLLINEDGIDRPYYVIRATAGKGKRTWLVVSLHDEFMLMTKNNPEIAQAARKAFWTFLNELCTAQKKNM